MGPSPTYDLVTTWESGPSRCTVEAVHFVIMGCGRVGSALALALEKQGQDVAIIDRDAASFRRLGPDFEGRRVTGIGFDRDTLVQAGIENAYAFAAVSSGDNSNILAARVARETYGVQNVVARIYDPGRAEIYQRLGIPTVATVRWTADRMIRRLMPHGAVPQFTDPSGKVVVGEVHCDPSWIGQTTRRIEEVTGARVAYLGRLGEGLIPGEATVLQDGDILNVICETGRLDEVGRLLDREPPND